MSQCHWCDTCERPYPESDPDARAIQVQEPEIINGIRRGVVTIERHQCGDCTRAQAAAREARRRAITADEQLGDEQAAQ